MRALAFVLAVILVVLISRTTSCIANVHAQEGVVTSKLKPIYLGAQGGEFHSDPIIENNVFAPIGKGLYTNFWFSSGFDTKKNFGKELDLAIGYGGALGKIAYTTEFQYYMIQGIDLANWNSEITFRYLFARLEAYAPTQHGGPGKGLIPSVGYRALGLPLFDHIERVKIDMGQWVKYDTGSFGFDELWLYQGMVGTTFWITPLTGANAGMRWSIPLQTHDDAREGRLVWEFGITRRF